MSEKESIKPPPMPGQAITLDGEVVDSGSTPTVNTSRVYTPESKIFVANRAAVSEEEKTVESLPAETKQEEPETVVEESSSPATASISKPPVPPVRQSPAYTGNVAPNLTSYDREFTKLPYQASRKPAKVGKAAFFTALTMVLLATVFSWVPPAGLDWFLALTAGPVSIFLAIVSFYLKEKVGFGIFAILLGVAAPAVPAVMFFIGLIAGAL